MIRVKTMTPTKWGVSELRFEIEVYRSGDGVEWFLMEDAPECLIFQATEILAITNDEEMTDEAKKIALAEMFTTKLVNEYRLGQQDDALGDLDYLMAGQWPVTVNL